MSTVSHRLASGPGWFVQDVICTAGPQDRSFEEQHDTMSIALVTSGTFVYRTTAGRALLGPGSLLLGNHGQCFECGHEHGAGDRCLSFRYAPGFFESLLDGVPGARRCGFSQAHLPAVPALAGLLAGAEAARDRNDAAALEETAVRVAGAVVTVLAGHRGPGRAPSRRDERRISDALRRIEERVAEPLSLAALAREAAMSPYHFLRVFRQVAGLTPHQYLLRLRLHRAATRLRRGDDPIAAIAYESGFGDLSTFNRRFRRVIGSNPAAYRR